MRLRSQCECNWPPSSHMWKFCSISTLPFYCVHSPCFCTMSSETAVWSRSLLPRKKKAWFGCFQHTPQVLFPTGKPSVGTFCSESCSSHWVPNIALKGLTPLKAYSKESLARFRECLSTNVSVRHSMNARASCKTPSIVGYSGMPTTDILQLCLESRWTLQTVCQTVCGGECKSC